MGENGTVVPLVPVNVALNHWPLKWLIVNSCGLTLVVFLHAGPSPYNVRHQEKCFRASLVAHWYRIHLPIPETWVQSLIRKHPTCL